MRKSGKQRGTLNSDAVLQVFMLTFSPLVKDTGTHWFQDSQGYQKKPCLNIKCQSWWSMSLSPAFGRQGLVDFSGVLVSSRPARATR